ncbi:hypothetical protein FNV68_19315 [Streptomyces sp. S1D4-23]|nr:hypothetical protein FNV61_18215 [Streptomyces sp. RLB3-6]QDO08128.1 hypothetical protein FNV68_19315 [Streptomyces sp. S1D4-23]
MASAGWSTSGTSGAGSAARRPVLGNRSPSRSRTAGARLTGRLRSTAGCRIRDTGSSLKAVRGYDDATGVGTPTSGYIESFRSNHGH